MRAETGDGLRCNLPHEEAFPMRNSEGFAALGAEVNIALAQKALQFAEPDLVERLAAMGAEWLNVIFLFQSDHFECPIRRAVAQHSSPVDCGGEIPVRCRVAKGIERDNRSVRT